MIFKRLLPLRFSYIILGNSLDYEKEEEEEKHYYKCSVAFIVVLTSSRVIHGEFCSTCEICGCVASCVIPKGIYMISTGPLPVIVGFKL